MAKKQAPKARKPKPLKAITTIADLTPDAHNARAHNPRNVGMIEAALGEVGAARSIVIDEDGRILAGNGTIEAAARAGITRVQVVEGDGETIVAVRRAGLSEKEKRRLALYDNRSAELATWDGDALAAMMREDEGALKGLFAEHELAAFSVPNDSEWGALSELPDGDRAPFQQMTFTLHDSQVETVREAIRSAIARGASNSDVNENSNGNALAFICAEFCNVS